MRIEIELLEYHGRIFLGHFQMVLFGNGSSGNGDGACCRILQMVDASDKGRFSGTGGTDDDQLLAFLYSQINIFQDLQVTEILFQMFDFYHVSHIIHLPELPVDPAHLAFLKKCKRALRE